MAEYIVHRRFQGMFRATSAGVQPGSFGDTANAVFTLKQFGIDASVHVPRDIRDVNPCEFELIVTMDNHVAGELSALFPDLHHDRLVKWSINDPYGDDLQEYDRCAKVIHRELKKLLSKVEEVHGVL